MSIMSSKSTFHHLNRFFILKPSITLSQTICIQCDFWICKAVETFPPSSSGSTNKVSSTKSEEGTYICLSYGKYVQGTIPMMRTKEVDVLEQVQSKDIAKAVIIHQLHGQRL
ncbi:hypothetical protein YC2023_016394 [Brassica napus]